MNKIIILLALILIPFAYAEVGYNEVGYGVHYLPSEAPINYSLIPTVNSTNWWNTISLGPMDDAQDGQFNNIGGTLTIDSNYIDANWCALTGCTMSGNIDMGGNNINNINSLSTNDIIIWDNTLNADAVLDMITHDASNTFTLTVTDAGATDFYSTDQYQIRSGADVTQFIDDGYTGTYLNIDVGNTNPEITSKDGEISFVGDNLTTTGNVNGSYIFGVVSHNETQMNYSDEKLNIRESWLTTFINSFGFLNSITNIFDQSLNKTDDVTFASVNVTGDVNASNAYIGNQTSKDMTNILDNEVRVYTENAPVDAYMAIRGGKYGSANPSFYSSAYDMQFTSAGLNKGIFFTLNNAGVSETYSIDEGKWKSQTTGEFNFDDDNITTTGNVNGSYIFGVVSHNETQMNYSDEKLNIRESWLTTFINSFGFLTSITNIFNQSLNTTDNVEFANINITANITLPGGKIYNNGTDNIWDFS